MLAETTGGRYFHAQDTETLKEVYAGSTGWKEPLRGTALYEYRELCMRPLSRLRAAPAGDGFGIDTVSVATVGDSTQLPRQFVEEGRE